MAELAFIGKLLTLFSKNDKRNFEIKTLKVMVYFTNFADIIINFDYS